MTIGGLIRNPHLNGSPVCGRFCTCSFQPGLEVQPRTVAVAREQARLVPVIKLRRARVVSGCALRAAQQPVRRPSAAPRCVQPRVVPQRGSVVCQRSAQLRWIRAGIRDAALAVRNGPAGGHESALVSRSAAPAAARRGAGRDYAQLLRVVLCLLDARGQTCRSHVMLLQLCVYCGQL